MMVSILMLHVNAKCFQSLAGLAQEISYEILKQNLTYRSQTSFACVESKLNIEAIHLTPVCGGS